MANALTLDQIDALSDEVGMAPAFVRSLLSPAVQLTTTDEERFSRLGGEPDLPLSVEWPRWEVTEYDAGQLAYAEESARNPENPKVTN